MLSMDLRALPAEHQRIIRAWLAFYRRAPRPVALRSPSASQHRFASFAFFPVSRRRSTLGRFYPHLSRRTRSTIEGHIRRLWILNGGAQERLYTRLEGVEGEHLQVQVYDRCLEKSAAFELPVEDRAVILDLAVGIGGALELHR